MIEHIHKTAKKGARVEVYLKDNMFTGTYESTTPSGDVKIKLSNNIDNIQAPFFVIIRGDPVICFEATTAKETSESLFISINKNTICNEQTRDYIRVSNICKAQLEIAGEEFEGSILCKDLGFDGLCLLLVPSVYVPDGVDVTIRLTLANRFPFWDDNDVLSGTVCWCEEKDLPADMDLPEYKNNKHYSLLGIKFKSIGSSRNRKLQKIIMACQINDIKARKTKLRG